MNEDKYVKAKYICRGSIGLGTGCGTCEKCKDELLEIKEREPINPMPKQEKLYKMLLRNKQVFVITETTKEEIRKLVINYAGRELIEFRTAINRVKTEVLMSEIISFQEYNPKKEVNPQKSNEEIMKEFQEEFKYLKAHEYPGTGIERFMHLTYFIEKALAQKDKQRNRY